MAGPLPAQPTMLVPCLELLSFLTTYLGSVLQTSDPLGSGGAVESWGEQPGWEGLQEEEAAMVLPPSGTEF